MRKRTTRLPVEACTALDIRQLALAGVFQRGLGNYHELTWTDPSSKTPRKALFCVETRGSGRENLSLVFLPTGALTAAERPIKYTIEVSQEPCRFGGIRRWLHCPLFRDGVACKRRVQALFLPPGREYFGCRTCYNLTYGSVQSHDHRVDDLSRRSFQELNDLLKLPFSRSTALVLKASQKKCKRPLNL